jgi:hypothetical protein
MVCNTESGSFTSELHVFFLKHMDDLDLFPREHGLKPFLLSDGHNSRLELPFLQYVNILNHEWVVYIESPMGHHIGRLKTHQSRMVPKRWPYHQD